MARPLLKIGVLTLLVVGCRVTEVVGPDRYVRRGRSRDPHLITLTRTPALPPDRALAGSGLVMSNRAASTDRDSNLGGEPIVVGGQTENGTLGEQDCDPNSAGERVEGATRDTRPLHARLFETDRSPRGVFVMASGLNNHPSTLEAYARIVNDRGFHAVIATLTHQGDALHGATFEQWIEEFGLAWTHAKTTYPDLPRFSLAYSTGALAALTHAARFPDEARKGAVFIAPAIKLRAYAYVSRLLRALRGRSIVFPSRAPLRYRAHKFTSFDSYASLHDGIDTLEELEDVSQLRRVPTLVVMSPRDELLSMKRVRDWAERKGLSWTFEEVHAEHTYQHLLLDDSCGPRTWSDIENAIDRFLTKIVHNPSRQ